MRDGAPFSGRRIALVCAGAVVAYLRDDKEGIPFPGLWDLPGGGREGEESPLQCALREVEEEFGLRLQQDRVLSMRRYPGVSAGAPDTYFCVSMISPDEVQQIEFGNEGQHWLLMDAEEFIAREDAVPHMKRRLEQHSASFRTKRPEISANGLTAA